MLSARLRGAVLAAAEQVIERNTDAWALAAALMHADPLGEAAMRVARRADLARGDWMGARRRFRAFGRRSRAEWAWAQPHSWLRWSMIVRARV